ncbi:hypothetical protein SA58113_1649 [Staphylococcus argenteus]|nr:hypothetical protein SA58113_1649 [Staphylococcus argenteus]
MNKSMFKLFYFFKLNNLDKDSKIFNFKWKNPLLFIRM